MTLLAQFAALGGGVGNYIEDVFSTYLYTGNGSTQTIVNGIDLADRGGLVWLKSRTEGTGAYVGFHNLFDTARGATKLLKSDATDAEATNAASLTAFSGTGFSIGNNANINDSADNFVSWTFRKQPKFFDVVTYTGTGANRTVAHNLGSVPGCIIVKRTDTTADWQVYHRNLANTEYMVLNSTAAVATGATRWNSTTPTSTVFSLGTDTTVNASGGTYVAYLFAHNAGGFGLTGTDNVISCGSFTYSGSVGVSVTLGYEPQWIMYKSSTALGGGTNWIMHDMMRGMPVPPSTTATLAANNSGAESSSFARAYPTANGFTLPSGLGAADDYIYIAIRRGPMKVPTTGTSVFTPLSRAGTATTSSVTSISFPPDLLLVKERNVARPPVWWDKLRDPNRYIDSSNTAAEGAAGSSNGVSTLDQSGATYNPDTGLAWVNDNFYSDIYVNYFFRRAPGFFDEVCYTGTGTSNIQSHNLTVVPELIISKERSSSSNPWIVAYTGTTNGQLNNTTAFTSQLRTWTSTTFEPSLNSAGATIVAYLFATCPGVSKIGVYAGTGTTQTINCGFTAGSRFVMIKRTDSTGDWYVWDSARGIVAGNDPYLLLNSTAAEVTSTDYIDTAATGFEITNTAPAAINASGGTYIFLAIA